MSEGEKYSEACILKTNLVKAGGRKLYFVQTVETNSAHKVIFEHRLQERENIINMPAGEVCTQQSEEPLKGREEHAGLIYGNPNKEAHGAEE